MKLKIVASFSTPVISRRDERFSNVTMLLQVVNPKTHNKMQTSINWLE